MRVSSKVYLLTSLVWFTYGIIFPTPTMMLLFFPCGMYGCHMGHKLEWAQQWKASRESSFQGINALVFSSDKESKFSNFLFSSVWRRVGPLGSIGQEWLRFPICSWPVSFGTIKVYLNFLRTPFGKNGGGEFMGLLFIYWRFFVWSFRMWVKFEVLFSLHAQHC